MNFEMTWNCVAICYGMIYHVTGRRSHKLVLRFHGFIAHSHQSIQTPPLVFCHRLLYDIRQQLVFQDDITPFSPMLAFVFVLCRGGAGIHQVLD